MRPALDGFYGIPQETRLLFAELSRGDGWDLQGLLQMSVRATAGGTTAADRRRWGLGRRIHGYSQTVVSLRGAMAADWRLGIAHAVGHFFRRWGIRLGAWGLGRPIPLRDFETRYFEDFIWQQLFARSVPPEERAQVLRRDYQVCSAPWRWMHLVGMERAGILRQSGYAPIDTRGYAIFLAQTPYPGRVSAGTQLLVHYHDAIPVLMPHTISDRAFHESSHFHALAANVRNGAWFACVSEATRQDLLSLFPEAAERAVVVHNMLPSHYFPAAPEPERVPGIIRRYQIGDYKDPKAKKITRTYRLGRTFGSEAEKSAFYAQAFAPEGRFLLMVSTVEPRKNHRRLLEAWELLRDRHDPDLKLVFVGHVGWDYQDFLSACETWVDQGSVFLLHNVPADALRVLFRQAILTVCPSVGEGFDFSGVEAMRCGGVVAASDIPVHREVYGEAADYFDPYDTADVVRVLAGLLHEDGGQSAREQLRQAGIQQSARYLPEAIMPQWQALLARILDAPA